MNRRQRISFLLLTVLLLGGLLLRPDRLGAQVRAESVAFPGYEEMDGAYHGLLAAANGRVYLGLCTHNGRDDAVLLEYDPTGGRTRLAADLGRATGEKGRGRLPQGKLHTRIREGRDGRFYFATHFSYPLNDLKAKIDYPGGAFLSYDPKTGRCRVLGRAPAGEGIISAELAPEQELMYGLTYPSGLFLVCDLRRGRVSNLGPATDGKTVCRSLGCDSDGNAYFSREPDLIVRYDRRARRLQVLPTRVPSLDLEAPEWAGNTVGRRIWRTVVWDRTAGLFYGVHGGTSKLFSFHPASGQVKDLGQVCSREEIGREKLTYATLALAQAPDATLYYVPARGLFDYFNSQPLNGPAHLVVRRPGDGQPQDLGPILCEDGRRLFGSQSAAVSPDGRTLYLLGAVEAKTGDRSVPFTTLPVAGADGPARVPYQLRLLKIDLADLPAGPAAAARQPGRVNAGWFHSFSAEYPYLDGQWHGIITASDGRTYFAVASHEKGHHTQFFVFDPKLKKVTHLADLGEVCGETNSGRTAQGKIHSQISEHKGRLYFTTLHADYTAAGEADYPGGHIISYDLKSGRFTDFGIPRPGEGLETAALDPGREVFYALSWPGDHGQGPNHLVGLDLKSGRTRDLGIAEPPGPVSRMLLVDGRGVVYSARSGGRLWRFDPASGRIEELDLRLPEAPYAPAFKPDDKNGRSFVIRSGFWAAAEKCFYLLVHGTELLCRFHPESGRFEALGDFGLRKNYPRPAALGFCRSGRRIYYTAWGEGRFTNLVSYDLDKGTFTDHGTIYAEGRRAAEIHALSAGPDGKIYAVAALYNAAGDPVIKRSFTKGGQAYQMAFLVIDPERDFQ